MTMAVHRWLRKIVGPPRKWDMRTASSCQNEKVAPHLLVYFNGRELRDCVAYDCSRGVAEVYRRDEERGWLVISPSRTQILTKIVSGEVSATWRST